MVVHVYNVSTQEVEAERSWIQGQAGLQSENVLKKPKQKRKEKKVILFNMILS
jgi:hypothetical protein